MQSLLYLTRIYTQLGTDLHNNVSIVLFLSIIAAMVCEGIQPERLNAEGDSPSALSRGLSVSATLGTRGTTGKVGFELERLLTTANFPLSISHI